MSGTLSCGAELKPRLTRCLPPVRVLRRSRCRRRARRALGYGSRAGRDVDLRRRAGGNVRRQRALPPRQLALGPRAQVDAAARPLDDPPPDCRDVHAVRVAGLRRSSWPTRSWSSSGRAPLRASCSTSPGSMRPTWLTALVFVALGWVGVVAVPELSTSAWLRPCSSSSAAPSTRSARSPTRSSGRIPLRRPSATTRSSTCS